MLTLPIPEPVLSRGSSTGGKTLTQALDDMLSEAVALNLRIIQDDVAKALEKQSDSPTPTSSKANPEPLKGYFEKMEGSLIQKLIDQYAKRSADNEHSNAMKKELNLPPSDAEKTLFQPSFAVFMEKLQKQGQLILAVVTAANLARKNARKALTAALYGEKIAD
ncbi:uncharacterized protein TEOVI_000247700 [Trypanosoma equiperdum]|uniref:Trypanosomal VSG domain containing protein n=1 Tax=Trypanosoma equiperdum TaxID=5694 RepID=A0A1G4IFH8_TRYEQ|nr:hypothetical protein TEOVI_000247700 [Trypanosoma equiperdum]